MKKYVIHGGRALKGEVLISGSKNAALPILAATLLTDEDVILRNVPVLKDIETMVALLVRLGKKVQIEDGRMIVRRDAAVKGKALYEATYDIVKQMRASVVVLGPLLARHGKAVVSLPGGCAFGPRPVDLHMRAMEELGAKVELVHGDIVATAKRLKGRSFDLMGEFGSSVLATDNAAMAAVFAEGATVIENAAREPETEDLMDFLNALGAKVEGGGTSELRIQGVKKLHGCEYEIIPDRIEAGTFAVAAAVTGGTVRMKFSRPEHLEAPFELLREVGVGVEIKKPWVTIKGKKPSSYKGFTVRTMPYPRFPTDLQSLYTILATLAGGTSSIREGIYTTRWNHVPELVRMGARVVVEEEAAHITGVKKLEGASVQASDLRAGAALVVAGLAAKGVTEVRRIYHVDRGYENLLNKITALGGKIELAADSLP